MWSTKILLLLSLVLFVVSAEIVDDMENISPASEQKIHEITKKIDKIAYNLLKHSSLNNRDHIVSILENKLLKAAGHLGPKGKKHVQVIMEGIKLKLLNGTKDNKQKITEKISRRHLDDNSKENNDHLVKTQFVDELFGKIELLIESELKKLKTPENKKSLILSLIKNKLLESVTAKENKILRENHDRINGSRRMTRRKLDAKIKDSPNNKTSDELDKIHVKLEQNFSHINIYKASNKHKTLTTRLSCSNFFSRTCDDIKKINTIKCPYDLGYIGLDKLCDGTFDCPSKSDEYQCDSQVMEKVHYAKQVMAELQWDKYKCFDDNRSILVKQSQILRNLLESKLVLRGKHKNLNSSFHEFNGTGENDFNYKLIEKREANEVAVIISSLALALDGALCSNKVDFDTRRNNDIFEIDIDRELEESVTPSKTCNCEKEFCFNCTYYCKRICRQKYSLSKWNCESINGTATISLNFLCDGKLDCYDESDERGCLTDHRSGYAKFEALEIYKNILKMLQLKASKERQSVQKKLLYLSISIMKLQNLTMKSVPKLELIKKQRDKCYSIFRAIYSVQLKESYILNELDEIYVFLLSINQNLATALKRSHTGNSRIIANGCHCRNGACSVSFCSKFCVRACTAEPKLTRYNCKGRSNKSITIDKICNDVLDCADGTDEFNCKKDEICRRHHLVLLRHKLQNVGENLKGTALGELLSAWKAKVISTLIVSEKNERPTPPMFKKVVQDILSDLVVTYGSVENYRRSNRDYALREFLDVSQILLESIKSCRK